MDDKGFALILLILVAAGVCALAVLGWGLVRPYSSLTDQSVETHSQLGQTRSTPLSGTQSLAVTTTSTRQQPSQPFPVDTIATSTWNTYTNTGYGFSFKYP